MKLTHDIEAYADGLSKEEMRGWEWDFAYYGPCEKCGSKNTYRTTDYVLVCKDCNHEEYIG